ncbi:hypothetical protein CRG98_000429 [Punica granatum]|uniref:Uncharacterized protein n=1 Tax=Punica granatum TaxID=22663 RepID=A0A2I0LEN0_PUNGR|nr:hypothetical protein CRG98_000429 [Punica granatum]
MGILREPSTRTVHTMPGSGRTAISIWKTFRHAVDCSAAGNAKRGSSFTREVRQQSSSSTSTPFSRENFGQESISWEKLLSKEKRIRKRRKVVVVKQAPNK